MKYSVIVRRTVEHTAEFEVEVAEEGDLDAAAKKVAEEDAAKPVDQQEIAWELDVESYDVEESDEAN